MEGMVEEETKNAAETEDGKTGCNCRFVRLHEQFRNYYISKPKESNENRMYQVKDNNTDMDLDDDQSSGDEGLDCIGYDWIRKDMNPRQWRVCYDMSLCSRLGLFCYNFQEGTDYNFEFVSKTYTKFGSFTKFFITTEASMNPADTSPLTFETFIHFADPRRQSGELWWETSLCRVKGSKEVDHEWNYVAIHEWYKGELPKWLSDDNLQHCYVVQESELLDEDNWWLHLFTEFAFYTKWYGKLRVRDVADCLPLETQKVVVETRGDAETEPREKLKAANAVFYISFKCGDDPLTGEVASYRAVVRKTMDGKPGHMRLDVRCWSI